MSSRRWRPWARGWVLGLLALLAAVSPAQSQREERGGAPGSFDFFVLALTWQAGFCALEGDARERESCAPGRRRGFTLHGLWPQFERGYPTACGAERSPTRDAMAVAARYFESDGLARHQWRKHGTCSGLDPAAYFAASGAAFRRVAIPRPFLAATPPARWTVADIERAFVEANPGLRADMLSVSCRRETLEEVRICFTRDLRGFRPCPEVDRRGCNARVITVPPPR